MGEGAWEEAEGEDIAGPMERQESKVQVMLFVVIFQTLITSFSYAPWLLIWVSWHVCVHLTCRWVKWGRRGQRSDEGGASAGGSQVMDGDGGVQALAEEEVQGLLHKVYPFYLVWSVFQPILSLLLFLSLIFVMDPIFFKVWIY